MTSMIRKTKILSRSTYFCISPFPFALSAMLSFYLFLFLFNTIQIDSKMESCHQTFGSNEYDLNQLSDFTIAGEEKEFKYVITPCGLVPTDRCGSSMTPFEQGMTACQERFLGPSSPTFESSMGFLDGSQKPPNIEFKENPAGPGTGVVMIMRNAMCSGRERLVTVTFTCDKSVTNPSTMDVHEISPPGCEFTMNIKAAKACPLGSGGSGSNGGISGGTVFIIILLVVIVLYVVGGVIYNKTKLNQTGVALLPHPSFWLGLVGSFLTGCRFTLTYIRTCGKGSSAANYNTV